MAARGYMAGCMKSRLSYLLKNYVVAFRQKGSYGMAYKYYATYEQAMASAMRRALEGCRDVEIYNKKARAWTEG